MLFKSSLSYLTAFLLFCLSATVSATPHRSYSRELSVDELDNESGLHLLKETVNRLNDAFQKPIHYVLFDVHAIYTKTFIETFYHLNLTLAPSVCFKGIHRRATLLHDCKLNHRLEFQKCVVDVVHRSVKGFPASILLLNHNCVVTEPTIPDNLKVLGFSVPPNAGSVYLKFKQDHSKQYTPEEDMTRFGVFKSNLLLMQFLQTIEQGSAIYGVTPFADLTQSEFKRSHLTMKWTGVTQEVDQSAVTPDDDARTKSFDWRQKGAVTPVRDQGACGSCWAFSAVENIEGQWFLKTGKLVSLSEQQLLDCDKKDEGCNGGLPLDAYRSVINSGGIMSSEDYPYEAKEEPVCHFRPKGAVAYVNDSVELPKDESQLAIWLVNNGPISVGLNALTLQFYFGGIVHPFRIFCSAAGIDHAVLLVGYGTSSILRRPFWIVKNSWGPSWGESGYFRIYRGDGTCGINQVATSAVIK